MSAEPLRVLIIEDVPMDAELVQYELGRARIREAVRGVAALVQGGRRRARFPVGAGGVHPGEFSRAELVASAPAVLLGASPLPRFAGRPGGGRPRGPPPAIPFLIVTGSI